MGRFVNASLKQKIIGQMPSDLSNLEKAIYIYDRMCHTLEYALDYYADCDKVGSYYADPANISKVDGEENKSVVCYTFKEIFYEICHDTGVITDEVYDEVKLQKEKFHETAHDERMIMIDGEIWNFDAVEGILDGCDLTMAKFSTHKYKSWEPVENDDEKASDMQRRLDEAYDKVCLNANAERAAEEYYSIKLLDKSYQELPIGKRVDMFLDLVTTSNAPSHSILGLSYIIQLKRALFSKEEMNGTMKKVTEGGASYNIDRYVGLLIVYDTKSEQYKTIFAYNPLGYNDAKGFENFDSLILFEIDQKAKTVKEVDIEELKEKFNRGEYVERSTTSKKDIYSDNSSLLMKQGAIVKKDVFEGGKAIYDAQQKPTNLLEVVVTYLDGRDLTLTPEQYALGEY